MKKYSKEAMILMMCAFADEVYKYPNPKDEAHQAEMMRRAENALCAMDEILDFMDQFTSIILQCFP